MRKTMIIYSLSGRKDALDITRKIYGYNDSSNHGRYKYKRKGILSNISYEKISRCTFWIDPKYKKRVVDALTKLRLRLKIYDLVIQK
jgi:hypothetical protein